MEVCVCGERSTRQCLRCRKPMCHGGDGRHRVVGPPIRVREFVITDVAVTPVGVGSPYCPECLPVIVRAEVDRLDFDRLLTEPTLFERACRAAAFNAHPPSPRPLSDYGITGGLAGLSWSLAGWDGPCLAGMTLRGFADAFVATKLMHRIAPARIKTAPLRGVEVFTLRPHDSRTMAGATVFSLDARSAYRYRPGTWYPRLTPLDMSGSVPATALAAAADLSEPYQTEPNRPLPQGFTGPAPSAGVWLSIRQLHDEQRLGLPMVHRIALQRLTVSALVWFVAALAALTWHRSGHSPWFGVAATGAALGLAAVATSGMDLIAGLDSGDITSPYRRGTRDLGFAVGAAVVAAHYLLDPTAFVADDPTPWWLMVVLGTIGYAIQLAGRYLRELRPEPLSSSEHVSA